MTATDPFQPVTISVANASPALWSLGFEVIEENGDIIGARAKSYCGYIL